MAGIAMLVLAMIAAVAIVFVLRAEDGADDAEHRTSVLKDREPTR